jgi:hypothetical protein
MTQRDPADPKARLQACGISVCHGGRSFPAGAMNGKGHLTIQTSGYREADPDRARCPGPPRPRDEGPGRRVARFLSPPARLPAVAVEARRGGGPPGRPSNDRLRGPFG